MLIDGGDPFFNLFPHDENGCTSIGRPDDRLFYFRSFALLFSSVCARLFAMKVQKYHCGSINSYACLFTMEQ